MKKSSPWLGDYNLKSAIKWFSCGLVDFTGTPSINNLHNISYPGYVQKFCGTVYYEFKFFS